MRSPPSSVAGKGDHAQVYMRTIIGEGGVLRNRYPRTMDVWSPLLVALIALIGIVITTTMSTRSSRLLAEAQLRQQVELRRIDQQNSERMRLVEQKHAAYAALLAEIPKTAEAHVRATDTAQPGTSIKIFGTELAAAGAQAKLLLDRADAQALQDILEAYRLSHFRDQVRALADATALLQRDLAGR